MWNKEHNGEKREVFFFIIIIIIIFLLLFFFLMEVFTGTDWLYFKKTRPC